VGEFSNISLGCEESIAEEIGDKEIYILLYIPHMGMRSLFYKLSLEASVLAIVAAIGYGVSEILFPNMLSDHVSVFEVAVFVMTFLLASILLARKEWLRAEGFSLTPRMQWGIATAVAIFVAVGSPDTSWIMGAFLFLGVLATIRALLGTIFSS